MCVGGEEATSKELKKFCHPETTDAPLRGKTSSLLPPSPSQLACQENNGRENVKENEEGQIQTPLRVVFTLKIYFSFSWLALCISCIVHREKCSGPLSFAFSSTTNCAIDVLPFGQQEGLKRLQTALHCRHYFVIVLLLLFLLFRLDLLLLFFLSFPSSWW